MSEKNTGDNLKEAHVFPTEHIHVAQTQALLNVLKGEDELGVVVRAHIYIEYQLDQFIWSALLKPKELGHINYSSRVRLALACGLRGDLKPRLNALGDLRNKFAHRIRTILTDEDVSRFYEDSGTETEILGWGRIPYFTQMSPKDRFIHCILGLWVTLITERGQLKKRA